MGPDILPGIGINLIHPNGEVICNTYFDKKAEDQEAKSFGEIFVSGQVPGQQLRLQVAESLDGAGHQLREIGNEECKFPQIPLRYTSAIINVNGVTHRLESIE